MKVKLKLAADFVGGVVIGDPEIEITGIAKIEEAKEGDLTFLYLPSYEKFLSTTKASAVIISPEFKKTRDDLNYIEVKNPNIALQKIIISFLKPKINLTGIASSASIDPTANIGKNVAVGKNVVIEAGCDIGDNSIIYHNTSILENVKIGKNCLIYTNVSIRENCLLGNNVIIHSNTVIGSDGFGYIPDEKGVYNKVPQIGNVILEDDVELGSNVSIDRAAIGSTIIKKGVKIDNLVQIAHNVTVGEHCIIVSQAGVAGSTKLGNYVILGGQVGLAGHLKIGNRVSVAAQSGVMNNIPDGEKWLWTPAQPDRQAKRQMIALQQLPELFRRVKELEKKLGEKVEPPAAQESARPE